MTFEEIYEKARSEKIKRLKEIGIGQNQMQGEWENFSEDPYYDDLFKLFGDDDDDEKNYQVTLGFLKAKGLDDRECHRRAYKYSRIYRDNYGLV
jgi:hypothetical protein